MLRRHLFVVALLGTTLLSADRARADMLPDGKTFVPVQLTLEGQEAFKETTFVLAGCSNENGRHYFSIAKAGQVLPCRIKMNASVYAVPNAERKAFDDLLAQDVGWGTEGVEARKLLEKVPECGKVEEQTLVDITAGIREIAAKYSLEKTATGCSLQKVSSTNVLANGAAAPASPSPSPSSNAAPASAPSAAPVKASSCAASPAPAPGGTLAGLFVIAMGLLALARRARR